MEERFVGSQVQELRGSVFQRQEHMMCVNRTNEDNYASAKQVLHSRQLDTH